MARILTKMNETPFALFPIHAGDSGSMAGFARSLSPKIKIDKKDYMYIQCGYFDKGEVKLRRRSHARGTFKVGK